MKLRGFLEYVDQCCALPTHAGDIYEATNQLVCHIMDAIGKRNPHFNVNEVISVGSFVEETKVCSPNEFDFMACLDFLSRKENVKIEAIKQCKPGYMMVFFDKEKAQDLPCLDFDENFSFIYNSSLSSDFSEAISEAIQSVKTFVTPKGALVIKDSRSLFLELQWHKFQHDYTGPNMGPCETNDLLMKTAYKMDIYVDIMPAIPVDDFSILSDLHGFPKHVLETLEKQRFFLVCKQSGNFETDPCLTISHAPSEVYLIRRLHPIHKKCYKVLKYLLTHDMGDDVIFRRTKTTRVSSYMLKNAVLFHEYDKLCSGTPDLAACSIEIIRYIRAQLRKSVFPPFFIRTTNIWGYLYRLPALLAYPSVTWLHVLRQFLGKALMIFKELESELPKTRSETENTSKSAPDDDLPKTLQTRRSESHSTSKGASEDDLPKPMPTARSESNTGSTKSTPDDDLAKPLQKTRSESNTGSTKSTPDGDLAKPLQTSRSESNTGSTESTPEDDLPEPMPTTRSESNSTSKSTPENASLQPVSQCYPLVPYVPNKYDPYISKFKVLKKDMTIMCYELGQITYKHLEYQEKEWVEALSKFPELPNEIESRYMLGASGMKALTALKKLAVLPDDI